MYDHTYALGVSRLDSVFGDSTDSPFENDQRKRFQQPFWNLWIPCMEGVLRKCKVYMIG